MDKIKLKMSLAAIGTGFMLSLVAINSNAQVIYPGYNNSGTWHNWSGAYFGSYFGAGSGNASTTFHRKDTFRFLDIVQFEEFLFTTAFFDNVETSGKLHGDITGSKADLFVGYNFNPYCTNFVFGGQLEGTIFSDIALKTIGQEKGNENFIAAVSFFDQTFVQNEIETINRTREHLDELRSMFSFVIRAGYLVSPPVLIYALAGLTEGHFVLSDTFNDESERFINGSRRNKWELGWTVGAGLEYQLTDNWFLRAEYRYLWFNISRSQFSSFSSAQSDIDNNTLTLVNETFHQRTKTEFNFNLGQIGIVYRF